MKPIRLPIRKIGYMLLLFPLLEPKILEQIEVIDLIITLMKLVSFTWILFLYVRKCRKVDKFILSIIACYFVGLISTMFNGTWLYLAIVRLINIVAMVLLVKILLEEDPMLCFDIFLPLLEILLYANLFSIFLFPNGMYTSPYGVDKIWTENWILGLDNAQVPYFIIGIAIAVVRDYYRFDGFKISYRSWCLITVCFVTVFCRWTVTNIVGMIVILPMILMPKLFTKSKLLNIITYLIIIAIFFFAVVIFRFQDYFEFVLQQVLHKSVTFHNRVFVWDRAISMISMNPWLGYGEIGEANTWGYLGHIHAHNIFLQILFTGGALQLMFFLCMNIVVAMKLVKNNHHKIACFLSVLIFSVLIIDQMETYQSNMFFGVYALAFYSNKIILNHQKIPTKKNRHSQIP